MIKEFLEIAGFLGMGWGKRRARKAAFQTLIKRGVLPSTAEFGTSGSTALMKRIGSKGFDADKTSNFFYNAKKAAKGAEYSPLTGRGLLHSVAAGRGAEGIEYAQRTASAAFREAAGQLRTGRALAGAERALIALPMFNMGFSMFSQADRFFEKNIPPPAQEIMQTQMAFLPRQAYTQRQRAIQAIHQSGMTTRSALGHESSYMHG